MRGTGGYQFEMFTPGGQPWSPDTMTREVRGRVLDALAGVFGAHRLDDVSCEDCGAATDMIAMPAVVIVRCRCGWFYETTPAAIFAEEDPAP